MALFYRFHQDIYYLEVCVFHKICANGDELFHLRAGQEWTCELSESGFGELQNMLLETPDWGMPNGAPAPCAQSCNQWMCDSVDCMGCAACQK